MSNTGKVEIKTIDQVLDETMLQDQVGRMTNE
jgi:hypothetical protein